MDVVPTNKPIIKSRSTRSRHGSIKGSPVRRPPSPDSACEHDGEWMNGNAVSGQEDVTSDMSEESGEKSNRMEGRRTTIKEATIFRRKFGETINGKGLAGQDSDVDSGIVTCRKPGQRIGSTSSADTDSSQESRRRDEYSPPIQKSELSKSRSYAGSLRIPKRSGCLSQSGGPVKADHSALKECNRRPPTPLTVFPDSHHCVRFDEQLQLSEQNIRRSCRKLFATLYAQRFSYPNHQDSPFLLGRTCSGSTRLRSRTVPELDLRRYSPISVDGQLKHGRSYKENMGPVEGRRSNSLAWSNRSVHKSASDASLGRKVASSLYIQRKPHTHFKYPMDFSEGRISHTNSTDSGLGSLRNSTHCTCHSRQSGTVSSQSTCIPVQCTCHCCSCLQQVSMSPENPPKLFKSNSCSTLPSVLSHQSRPHLTQFPPRTSTRKLSLGDEKSKAVSLQKTSSCSSLLDRASSNFIVSNVPVYSDNMVQVYARIASVIPDDCKSTPSSVQSGRRAKTLGRLRYTTDNVSDSIRKSNYISSSSSSNPGTPLVSGRKINSFGNDAILTTENPSHQENLNVPLIRAKTPDLSNNETDVKSIQSVEIYSQIADITSESFGRKSQRESLQSRSSSNYQIPKSIGVVIPNVGPNPVYLKSALKKPTQSAVLQVSDISTRESPTVLNGGANITAEVEYAVVDKSKKNRFASLPVLNNCNGTSNTAENDEKDPPVPPKKHLHKSDFSLYRSRSSSPKKSLLERMQTLTKNAKSALQKAFSTERIYRPEREERMEATGQKGLQRSRSFIKGLTGSFRKKRRKSRPPMAEVVPQASPSPEWDEQPLASNSPNHVRGQLLQLNLDGSQVVELTKPATKPYGFFVARGRVRNSKGVFVSRMRDQETQKQLAGLLDIGDEILEIDGYHVKDADILEVNRLMANKNTLLLTVLPYICRKDV